MPSQKQSQHAQIFTYIRQHLGEVLFCRQPLMFPKIAVLITESICIKWHWDLEASEHRTRSRKKGTKSRLEAKTGSLCHLQQTFRYLLEVQCSFQTQPNLLTSINCSSAFLVCYNPSCYLPCWFVLIFRNQGNLWNRYQLSVIALLGILCVTWLSSFISYRL